MSKNLSLSSPWKLNIIKRIKKTADTKETNMVIHNPLYKAV
ncbi:hypothetical protein ECBCE008MS01_4791, partial [Escherichia coli BCE008_MS-01]